MHVQSIGRVVAPICLDNCKTANGRLVPAFMEVLAENAISIKCLKCGNVCFRNNDRHSVIGTVIPSSKPYTRWPFRFSLRAAHVAMRVISFAERGRH